MQASLFWDILEKEKETSSSQGLDILTYLQDHGGASTLFELQIMLNYNESDLKNILNRLVREQTLRVLLEKDSEVVYSLA